MKIVFDTYAWIEYFRASLQGEIVKKYLETEEIITPSIVLLELSYRANKEGWDMKKYFNFIRIKSKIIGINEEFILRFGALYNSTKKKIKGIGLADVIILMTALLHDTKVLTGDEHFKTIKEAIILE